MGQLSAIRWYGGKHAVAKQIINLMPMHKTYVEVFGGGAHVLLNKKRAPVEVYNDLNKGLVSLFSVLRDKELTKELVEGLQLTLYSKEEFDRAVRTWSDKLDYLDYKRDELDKELHEGRIDTKAYFDEIIKIKNEYRGATVETARLFYVLCLQSFSTRLTDWRRGEVTTLAKLAPSIRGWLNGIDENLVRVAERFRTVHVENSSYEYILERYDGQGVLFYLDPPYIHDTRGESSRDVYLHEMSNSMHKDLVDRLLNLKGKFILSGYDHPIYDRLDDGKKFFKVKLDDVVKSCQWVKEGGKKDRGEEFLWINFKPGTI